jgi:hypothetical protein
MFVKKFIDYDRRVREIWVRWLDIQI